MASVPGHVFWLDLLTAILDHPDDVIRAYQDPLTATGPRKVTGVWREGEERYAAKVLKSVYLTPPTEYLRSGWPLPEKTHAVHACSGSWR